MQILKWELYAHHNLSAFMCEKVHKCQTNLKNCMKKEWQRLQFDRWSEACIVSLFYLYVVPDKTRICEQKKVHSTIIITCYNITIQTMIQKKQEASQQQFEGIPTPSNNVDFFFCSSTWFVRNRVRQAIQDKGAKSNHHNFMCMFILLQTCTWSSFSWPVWSFWYSEALVTVSLEL